MAITFDEAKYPQITNAEINEALSFCNKQILHILPQFTDKFQKAYSEDGFYQPIENNYWTTGFWTGEIWLAYEFSKDERLKGAKVIVSSPYTRALQTAAIISKETGLNIEVDMNLREWQPDLTYRYKSKDEMEELIDNTINNSFTEYSKNIANATPDNIVKKFIPFN